MMKEKKFPLQFLTKLFTTSTQLSPILTGHLLTHHLELRNRLGWISFGDISVFLLEKAGERKIPHDLNFLQESYEAEHVIQIPLNKPLLTEELAKSGSTQQNDGQYRHHWEKKDYHEHNCRTKGEES